MIQGHGNALHDVVERRKLSTGPNALIACGMQEEFAAELALMQQTNQTTLILRAGAPPVYDRPGAPKTGENLSKTSNQGFFKGRIAAQKQFTRIKVNKEGKNQPIGHHKKDAEKLQHGAQKTAQLQVRLKDIIRELREPGGDLKMTSYDPASGEMRFQYKPGKGDNNFKGDFVINVNQGHPFEAHYSRSTDRPDQDPKYNKEKGIITKPDGLDILSEKDWENLYKKMDNQEFNLFFTDKPLEKNLQEAAVFTNKQGLVITGDWDGLAIGHPPDLPDYARVVYNTFSEDPVEQMSLIQASTMLLNEKKQEIESKGAPNSLETAILKMTMDDLYDQFSLSRAGCITAHEFLHNSMANYLYREKNNNEVRNQSHLRGYQEAFDVGLLQARNQLRKGGDLEKVIADAKEAARNEYVTQNIEKEEGFVTPRSGPQLIDQKLQSDTFQRQSDRALEKIYQALEKNIRKEHKIYENTLGQGPLLSVETPRLLHPDLDTNLENPFQHGYDMRNPYGSNLDGPWLMVTDEGLTVHGKNQAELIDVMLCEGFLEKNHIDINFAADMSKGWDKVVERQIELAQDVPAKTLNALKTHKDMQKLQEELNPSLPSKERREPKESRDRSGSIAGFIKDPLSSPIVRRARSSSIGNFVASFVGKSAEDIAKSTGVIIENYSNHQQNIPEDLMKNYMDMLQKEIKSTGKLSDTSLKQVEVLLYNHDEMEPKISVPVMRAYMQQNPAKYKELMEKGIDLSPRLSSKLSGENQSARLQTAISQLAAVDPINTDVAARQSPQPIVSAMRLCESQAKQSPAQESSNLSTEKQRVIKK